QEETQTYWRRGRKSRWLCQSAYRWPCRLSSCSRSPSLAVTAPLYRCCSSASRWALRPYSGSCSTSRCTPAGASHVYRQGCVPPVQAATASNRLWVWHQSKGYVQQHHFAESADCPSDGDPRLDLMAYVKLGFDGALVSSTPSTS
ncbi:unnamed protein product, partial [Pylaiella littoralis]